jgi:hypothetical protein
VKTASLIGSIQQQQVRKTECGYGVSRIRNGIGANYDESILWKGHAGTGMVQNCRGIKEKKSCSCAL